MHPRNRHQDRYDLKALTAALPELSRFVKLNEHNIETIDFSDVLAVKTLNKALLKTQYGITFWDIPDEFLCPPVPGRADYIHSVADLFKDFKNLRVLDIGTGANCIYPLIGVKEYEWSFVGSDVNVKALKNAQLIIDNNKLNEKIELRLQKDSNKIFTNIIQSTDKFDLTMCNPPFHESREEAMSGTLRKWKNLGKKHLGKKLNFGGQDQELWFPGGEKAFISQMIQEGQKFKNQVKIFTVLVSKEKNLLPLSNLLKSCGARGHVLEMGQGNKKSRLLYWSYH